MSLPLQNDLYFVLVYHVGSFLSSLYGFIVLSWPAPLSSPATQLIIMSQLHVYLYKNTCKFAGFAQNVEEDYT